MTATPPPDEPGDTFPAYPGDASPYPDGAAGPAPEVPRPQVPQPTSVATAVRLMWIGAGLSVLGLIITFFSLSTIKDKIADQLRDQGKYNADNLDNAYHVAVAFSIVAALLAIGLWVWMAQANGRGRSWARIVATVLGALNIITFVVTIAQNEETVVQLVLSALNVIIAIAILALIWRSESSQFYRANSRHA